MSVIEYGEVNSRQKKIDMIESNLPFAIVIGCGGIGSWVALNLALSGHIENLILIDPDIIEQSNLNRTPFRICDIGFNKVEALKYIILERRIVDIDTYPVKTSTELSYTIKEKILSHHDNESIIIDCRDDVYDDFYHFDCKYYKLGYDGMEITMDGNPRKTPVWGTANNYIFTPSFICPAQLVANIIVTDILLNQRKNIDDPDINIYNCDPVGRLNDVFTINIQHLVKKLYLLSKREEL